jgi:hypothetical protein
MVLQDYSYNDECEVESRVLVAREQEIRRKMIPVFGSKEPA